MKAVATLILISRSAHHALFVGPPLQEFRSKWGTELLHAAQQQRSEARRREDSATVLIKGVLSSSFLWYLQSELSIPFWSMSTEQVTVATPPDSQTSRAMRLTLRTMYPGSLSCCSNFVS